MLQQMQGWLESCRPHLTASPFICKATLSLSNMSLLGKLKTAIKGNPVLREYELGKQVASAGPGLLWKVFNGEKKTTKQVSDGPVFTLYYFFRKFQFLYFTRQFRNLRKFLKGNVRHFLSFSREAPPTWHAYAIQKY